MEMFKDNLDDMEAKVNLKASKCYFCFNYFRRDDVFKDQSELQRPSTKNSRRFRGPPTSRR